jgi:hypothetical protein
MSMLLIVAAAAALSNVPPPPSSASATAQATATIRVVAAVRISFTAPQDADVPPAHDAVIKATDGTVQPAKIIDFQ